MTDSLIQRTVIAVGAAPDRRWFGTLSTMIAFAAVAAALLFLLQFAG